MYQMMTSIAGEMLSRHMVNTCLYRFKLVGVDRVAEWDSPVAKSIISTGG